jgi:23S rRNA pseudouridine1911/1915/1917 synthase
MGITRNGELIRSIDTVFPGDEIILKCPEKGALEPNAALSIPVSFENENIIVFNKPSGMPVHPSVKHQGDTLGNYFAYLYPELTFRPVNRLDKDTSGLCIVAKNAHTANLLQGRCRKIYYAAVEGVTDASGTIDAPIAREKESIILRCVRNDGQNAVTHFRQLLCNDKYSLEEIHLETGRTHQIRVHFSYIGHPLAGDDMYGGSRDDISRQALHCGQIIFNDPVSGERITVKSDMPSDMINLFKAIPHKDCESDVLCSVSP